MTEERLIWEDHFDTASLDSTKWNYRYGNWSADEKGRPVAAGWGNNELQYYTDSPKNLWLQESCLHIAARQEPSPPQLQKRCAYTSARIDTRGRFSFCYGRVEIRARCPAGTGLWPAVWMMPENSAYGPWAASGEIDILEVKGRLPDRVFSTIHYGGVSPDKTHQEYCFRLPEGDTVCRFHIYELIWREGVLSWKMDGREYASASCWESFTDGISYPQPFDRPFYLLINLAVGGWFDKEASGYVEEQALPGEFVLDYIRVYQEADTSR